MKYIDAYAVAERLGISEEECESFRGRVIKQREVNDPPMTPEELEQMVQAGVAFIMCEDSSRTVPK